MNGKKEDMKKGEGSEEVYDGWEPSYNVLVERSHNRLSVGSDKYSVIESSSTEDDNNNDNSYLTLIDMTSPEPVVRSRPDIIRDLPGKSRGLVRSTSFLSQAVGSRRSRWCGGGGAVQRSISNVTARPVCGIRAVREHQRQGSVSSTSSGSLGSSSFVPTNRPYISLESPMTKHYNNLPSLPSSNSAFRRPRQDKGRELEHYASQWQHRGCRRSRGYQSLI